MSDLLRSNFRRLAKSTSFWVIFFLMILCTSAACVYEYRDSLGVTSGGPTLDDVFFQLVLLIPILLSYSVSIFTTSDYDYGTLKNKIITGCSRTKIYLANFVTNSVSSIFILLGHMVASLSVGIPLLDSFELEPMTFFAYTLSTVFMVLACAAVFTMISMLNQNRSTAISFSIASVVITIILVTFLFNRLNISEYKISYIPSINDITSQKIPNPEYVSGFLRSLYQFIIDFLPTGQSFQIGMMDTVNIWVMPVYSVIVIIISTAVGIIFFRRKNIK